MSFYPIENEVLLKALSSFSPLEHRLELVGEKNGVQFINDSKATNTDSVRYALRSFDIPIRIIMGGSDKGEDYREILSDLKEHAKKIYLIGATKQLMKKAYDGEIEIEEFDTLTDAITKAYRDSSVGDYVVLSPACASYDMFKNFEHRGHEFKRIVTELG